MWKCEGQDFQAEGMASRKILNRNVCTGLKINMGTNVVGTRVIQLRTAGDWNWYWWGSQCEVGWD